MKAKYSAGWRRQTMPKTLGRAIRKSDVTTLENQGEMSTVKALIWGCS